MKSIFDCGKNAVGVSYEYIMGLHRIDLVF